MKLRLYWHLDWGSWLFGVEGGRCDFDTAQRYGIHVGPVAVGVWFGRIDIVRFQEWAKETPSRIKAWWIWQRLSPEERRRKKQEECDRLLDFRADAKERLKAWAAVIMEEQLAMRDKRFEP